MSDPTHQEPVPAEPVPAKASDAGGGGWRSWAIGGLAMAVGALVVIAGQRLLEANDFANRQARVASARAELDARRREAMPGMTEQSSRFRLVSEAVEPSVVDIVVARLDPTDDGRPGDPVLGGNGSGVIMDVDGSTGWVVTNNHVVANATDLTVTLHDGRRADRARVIGTDPRTDLAVLEVEAAGLVAAEWGDSELLAKGDAVLAFGSPFGYVGSMTAGIVSATGRSTRDPERGRPGLLGPRGYEDFIQTDAAINPGNSGGPLVDIAGNVIGINSAIASRTGAFNGIGFAIPAELARRVYDQLRADGAVTRGYLGVTLDDTDAGPRVDAIVRGTPAARDLMPGDLITGVNGEAVDSANDLRNRIASYPPGSEVTLDVTRDDGPVRVGVTLALQPDNQLNFDAPFADPVQGGGGGGAEGAQALGLRVAPLSPGLLRRLGLPGRTPGVVVAALRPGSPAAGALRPLEIISAVDGRPVEDVGAFAAALGRADLDAGVELSVTTVIGGAPADRIVTLRR